VLAIEWWPEEANRQKDDVLEENGELMDRMTEPREGS
jgi:hypothetical protein